MKTDKTRCPKCLQPLKGSRRANPDERACDFCLQPLPKSMQERKQAIAAGERAIDKATGQLRAMHDKLDVLLGEKNTAKKILKRANNTNLTDLALLTSSTPSAVLPKDTPPAPTMVDTEAIDPTPDAPALKKKKTTTSAKATKPKPKAKKNAPKAKKNTKKIPKPKSS